MDRGSHYAYTPIAGGKVDKNNPTQVGRACKQLGIQLVHAYSPEARGRSERMFGSLQKRLPQEFRVAGIRTIREANCYLKEIFVPEYNEQFCVTPELKESAFIPGIYKTYYRFKSSSKRLILFPITKNSCKSQVMTRGIIM